MAPSAALRPSRELGDGSGTELIAEPRSSPQSSANAATSTSGLADTHILDAWQALAMRRRLATATAPHTPAAPSGSREQQQRHSTATQHHAGSRARGTRSHLRSTLAGPQLDGGGGPVAGAPAPASSAEPASPAGDGPSQPTQEPEPQEQQEHKKRRKFHRRRRGKGPRAMDAPRQKPRKAPTIGGGGGRRGFAANWVGRPLRALPKGLAMRHARALLRRLRKLVDARAWAR
jgi:hypothetical protein